MRSGGVGGCRVRIPGGSHARRAGMKHLFPRPSPGNTCFAVGWTRPQIRVAGPSAGSPHARPSGPPGAARSGPVGPGAVGPSRGPGWCHGPPATGMAGSSGPTCDGWPRPPCPARGRSGRRAAGVARCAGPLTSDGHRHGASGAAGRVPGGRCGPVCRSADVGRPQAPCLGRCRWGVGRPVRSGVPARGRRAITATVPRAPPPGRAPGRRRGVPGAALTGSRPARVGLLAPGPRGSGVPGSRPTGSPARGRRPHRGGRVLPRRHGRPASPGRRCRRPAGVDRTRVTRT